MSKLIGYVMCSGCNQTTPGNEGLHIQGILRDGFHGPVIGDVETDSEYFFCSLDCLMVFLQAAGGPQAAQRPHPAAQGVATGGPSPGERIPLEDDWADGGKPVPMKDLAERFDTPPPPQAQHSQAPPQREGVQAPPKQVVARRRVVVSKQAQPPVAPRRLFQGEEPLGYTLPKGLPNTGKAPPELAPYVSVPETIGGIAAQMEAKVRSQIPKLPTQE